MKYLVVGSILIIVLLFGCIQPNNDTNINKDTNEPIIITGDNNSSPLIATCSDPRKILVITDTNEGQIWECV